MSVPTKGPGTAQSPGATPRAGTRPTTPPPPLPGAPTAVVIGAGISGLASAALLAREGYRVTVLEKSDVVGGRAASWESDGFRFDMGPSWYLMPEVFDRFFRLMGSSAAEELDLVPLDPGYRVFFEEGEPIDVPRGLERNIELFESVEPGAGERIRRYLASSRETYDIAGRRFLSTGFDGAGAYRRLLRRDVLTRLPLLSRLLVESLDSLVSRTVSDPRLRQILGYPAVFLGSSPFQTPSMYHLMSTLDLDDGVQYPMGGIAAVIAAIERLAREAGVEIVTGAEVTRIRTTAGRRPRATGAEYRDRSGATRSVFADLVVSAADLHHTETRLLPKELRSYDEAYWATREPGPSALLMYLGVEGELPELEHHTLFFSRDWHDNFARIFGLSKSIPEPPSLYVCKPSAVDPATAPAGQTNLFVLVPLPADAALVEGDARSKADRLRRLGDAVIDQIGAWAGIEGLRDRVMLRRDRGPSDFEADYHSWSGSMLGPAHTLRQSAMFRAGNRSKKVRALRYVGGSVRPGIGLPMCLISAEILVKELRGDRSTEPLVL